MKKTLTSLILSGVLFTGCALQRDERPPLIQAFDIASSIEYESEKDGEDYWKTPLETARDRRGDCEDKALYLQFLLKARGIETRLSCGIVTIESKTGHAWLTYDSGKYRYILDPTMGMIARRDKLSPLMYIEFDREVYRKRLEGLNKRIDDEKKKKNKTTN